MVSAGARSREFIRCPCCGARRPRTVFIGGALQQHPIEVLIQNFLGCGRGLDRDGCIPVDHRGRPLRGRARGAFHWTRRAPTISELELLGRAVAVAAERIASRLDGEPPEPWPEDVLEVVDGHFLDDARAELAAREELIAAEIERREGSSAVEEHA